MGVGNENGFILTAGAGSDRINDEREALQGWISGLFVLSFSEAYCYPQRLRTLAQVNHGQSRAESEVNEDSV